MAQRLSPLLGLLGGCTIANAGYDPLTTSGPEGTTTMMIAGSTSGGETSGPGDTGGPEDTGTTGTTGLEGSGGSSTSGGPTCMDPGGQLFEAVIPQEVQRMFCGTLLEVECALVTAPDGTAQLSGCSGDGGIRDLAMDLQLQPVGLDPAVGVADVALRMVHAGAECELRFVELVQTFPDMTDPRLLFAGGRVVPSPAELLLLDVGTTHDQSTACECELRGCCERPPGEYALEFTLEGVGFSVSMAQGSVQQPVDTLTYEAHNFRAFRSDLCVDRLDAHWAVRLVEGA